MRKLRVNAERLTGRDREGERARPWASSSALPPRPAGLAAARLPAPPSGGSAQGPAPDSALSQRLLGQCLFADQGSVESAAWLVVTCQVHKPQNYSNKSTSNKAWSCV